MIWERGGYRHCAPGGAKHFQRPRSTRWASWIRRYLDQVLFGLLARSAVGFFDRELFWLLARSAVGSSAIAADIGSTVCILGSS